MNKKFHLYFQGRKWYMNHFTRNSNINEFDDSNEVFIEMKIERNEKSDNVFVFPLFRLNSKTEWNTSFRSVARQFLSLVLQTTDDVSDLKQKVVSKAYTDPFSMFHVYVKKFGKLNNVSRPVGKLIPWPILQKKKRVKDSTSQSLVSTWQIEVQKNETETIEYLNYLYNVDKQYSENEKFQRKRISLDAFRKNSSLSSNNNSVSSLTKREKKSKDILVNENIRTMSNTSRNHDESPESPQPTKNDEKDKTSFISTSSSSDIFDPYDPNRIFNTLSSDEGSIEED